MNPIKLPYLEGALEPSMSKETLKFHFGKHYAAYFSNIQKLIVKTKYADADIVTIIRNSQGAVFNNAAQLFNHEFFFLQLTPVKNNLQNGELLSAIKAQFTSFEKFQEEFSAAANTVFGSGWAWLSKDNEGKLYITQESNAGTPLTQENRIPLLCFDVWEHAYYLDYQNRRAEFTNALWQLINWKIVEKRYMSTDILMN